MKQARTIKELERAVGGLSQPSKMPGFGYGIPAWECKLGSILRKKKGSTCERCYALKGMYVFPNVKKAQVIRMETLSSGTWVEDMTELISRKYRNRKGADRVFRWHDSGDIQSEEHLSMIVAVAKNLPSIRFWLPTRERTMVKAWKKANGEFPSNLVVRISMQMIGQAAPDDGGNWSTVGSDGNGFQCPAYNQGGECKNCRACWNPEVSSVNYPQH